jgi:putative endonuclease
MKTARQHLGKWGEDLAADYLLQRGYQIVDRNVRTPYGEIDLIACREILANGPPAKNLTVFVEVKTRSSTSFGLPEQAVTRRKRAHLLAAAQEYIRIHPELEGDWRVDVIAILRAGSAGPPQIEIFENAVTAE